MKWLVCPFFFTFMSFMMSWKSPPKALHSFSIPASIFSTGLEKSFSTSQQLFLPPPWRERNKNFQQSVEKLQKKNQLRLLFNIGSGVTTPRGQSPLFKKKKLFKNSSGKGRSGEHTWVQSEVLMLGFSQPMLPAGQLDKPPKNPHIMPEPAAFCLENVGHCF